MSALLAEATPPPSGSSPTVGRHLTLIRPDETEATPHPLEHASIEPHGEVAAPPVAEVYWRVKYIFAGRQWLGGGDLLIPIHVDVDATAPGEFTVFDPRTGIFGAGATPVEAIEDFRAALVEHRDVLEASQPLSDDLREQLELLRRYLRGRR
jgi:hypothetical protein